MRALIGSIATALALLGIPCAQAVVVEISYPEDDLVRAALFDIDDVPDRVFSVITNEDGTTEIRFGDGVSGARLPSGGSRVASYRYGSGLEGKIVNVYEIFENEFPLIPLADFIPPGANKPDISFVVAGLTSLKFDFSPVGLQVTGAVPSPIPLPPALLLFVTALLGLFGLDRRRDR